MATFSGVVTLVDNSVEVTVGLESETVTLTAGGVEVGRWSFDECAIREDGDGLWVIEAEEEALEFLPDDPDRFAETLANGSGSEAVAIEEAAIPSDPGVLEGPPPKPVTMAVFYALSALTAALGLWALVSLF